ncbi:MAG: PPOX class F420-dependent oxidoreductase [Gammaproteobacteria bacterium]|nr:PPOX class F420-dependent oxidoreductase [Gammaproteobacteria bacterium]
MTSVGIDIDAARYGSLVTYRRNGAEVATPVWLAPANGKHYLFSAGQAGKVKRLRANPQVRLARCTAGGRVKSGWQAGVGRVVTDAPTITIAYAALRAKYGWAMWLGDALAKLSGRYRQRAIIEITLDDERATHAST